MCTCPPAVKVWKSVLSSHVLIIVSMTVVIKPTPGGDGRDYSWGQECVWELGALLVLGGAQVGGGHSGSPVPDATCCASWVEGTGAGPWTGDRHSVPRFVPP